MNVELALAAIEDAKAHPDNFNMDSWHSFESVAKGSPGFTPPPCGTTACYAGFVALRVAPVESVIRAAAIHLPGAEWPEGIDDYAAGHLEITTDQASSLFLLNDLGEVERAVRYLADNPDVSGNTLFEMFSEDYKDESLQEDEAGR